MLNEPMEFSEAEIEILIDVLNDQIKDLEYWNLGDVHDFNIEPYKKLKTKIEEYQFFKYEYK
jgi:hypothetical protein